jgi:soluble lytic murein transglycosylase-like protein
VLVQRCVDCSSDPSPPDDDYRDAVASTVDTRSAAGRRDGAAQSKLTGAELRQVVDNVAGKTAVSARLIDAVILAESRYDPKAVSVKGAIGLMQLLPETARRARCSRSILGRAERFGRGELPQVVDGDVLQ